MDKVLELKELRSVDINSVELDNLVEIKDVSVDSELPIEQRVLEFVKQIKNPYLYKHGKTIVKISFGDTDITLEKRLKNYFETL